MGMASEGPGTLGMAWETTPVKLLFWLGKLQLLIATFSLYFKQENWIFQFVKLKSSWINSRFY